ncbi:hypothetical protein ACMFMG_002861 [Clarireedia jacksonii]
MVSKPNYKTSYAGRTAGQRDAVQIPPTFEFKCQRCGIFKTLDFYSNRVIDGYKAILAMSPSMKPHAINSGLKCRTCNDNQLHELACQGPCGEMLPLGSFSKNQRKGGLGWCKKCISWKESFIGGVPIPSAPGSGVQPGAFDFDVEPEDTTGHTLPRPAVDTIAQQTASMTIQTKPSGSDYVAPHLQGLADGQGSTPAAASGIDTRSESSASNIFEGVRTADMRSEAGWSTRDTRRRKGGPVISYNAYDPQGVHHLLTRAPSSRSSDAGMSTTHTLQSQSGAGIAPPRATVPRVPAASPVSPGSAARPSVDYKNGWARSVGHRTVPPAPLEMEESSRPEPPMGHRQRSRYDSSDDEI